MDINKRHYFYMRLIKVHMLTLFVMTVILALTISITGNAAAQAELPQRVAGADRVETAIAISKTGWGSAQTVLLTRTDEFADALTGTPLAYKHNAPILLTQSARLNEKTKAEIIRLKAQTVIILGGQAAVSTQVESELRGLGLTVERAGGGDRFETAKKIAEMLGPNPERKAVIAYGYDFPDALAVAPYAAGNGYPILLVNRNSIPAPIKDVLKEIDSTIIVGGPSAVAKTVEDQLDAERIAGEDRFATAAEIVRRLNPPSDKAYIATGMVFADALTGSVLAAKENASILLVRRDLIPAETKKVMVEKEFNKLIILGGLNAVGLPVERFIATGGALPFKLGNEIFIEKHLSLVKNKRVGLVTNQSGVNSRGQSMVELFAEHTDINLTALYGPEHGIDGVAKAGAYVPSYEHPTLKIPVYSLYGQTRMPTADMLKNVDVLVFDIQDIGARSYTYMSTLNYCMVAAKKYNKQIIVLDRPNPVGGIIVEGPVLEDPYISFVGIDNLPMAHGMTAGELARFFNRKIGVDLAVIRMEGYNRSMIFQDTGLTWVRTSPNITHLEEVFGYMATGLGEGTTIYQADRFRWIGGKGIDAQKFAGLMNGAGLPGVAFVPEYREGLGGVRLKIDNYRTFNPARTGIYALAYAKSLNNFTVPKSGTTIVMFDKIMGTNKIGQYLEQRLTPQQIVERYTPELNKFRSEREKYLIYGN